MSATCMAGSSKHRESTALRRGASKYDRIVRVSWVNWRVQLRGSAQIHILLITSLVERGGYGTCLQVRHGGALVRIW